MTEDIVIVDILKSIVLDTSSELSFFPGRSTQISKEINDFNNSETYKDKKYPMFAVIMPIFEKYGNYKVVVTIDRICLATLNSTQDDVVDRYKTGGTFKSVLYPLYREFFRALGRSKFIEGEDPFGFPHQKADFPGIKPTGIGITDMVDFIEISNLQLTLNQIKTC